MSLTLILILQIYAVSGKHQSRRSLFSNNDSDNGSDNDVVPV